MSRAASIAWIAPGTSPISSRAYETRAYEATPGRVSTIVWNVANASSYRPSSTCASPITP